MAGFHKPIFEVCERTSDALWSEPLNAMTSLGYLIVAYNIYIFRGRREELKGVWIWDVYVLNILIALIGISSFLFHTLSTKWAELMDMFSIVAFIVLYFFSCMVRVLHCNWLQIMVSFMAYAGLTHISVSMFPGAFNDSIGYLSSMAVLCVVALYLNMANRPSARMFLTAALLGCISLFMRTQDMMMCEYTSIGTHFLWHTFNCILIYILMQQVIRHTTKNLRAQAATADTVSEKMPVKPAVKTVPKQA